MLHHHLADRLRRHLVFAETFEFAHDLGHRLFDPFGIDIALAQRDFHRTRELVAVERHAAAVALDDLNSRSCTRSKVVKRKLQARHTRRRRMAAESSVGRESFTCVSRLAQLGQRIPSPVTPRSRRNVTDKSEIARSAARPCRAPRFRPRVRSTPFCDSTSSTSAMYSPIWRNSATPKPRVVPAGVPSRMPDVIIGFCGSKGMPFLLQVMRARPSAASATLPVSFLRPQIDQHQMRVGAARNDIEPLAT